MRRDSLKVRVRAGLAALALCLSFSALAGSPVEQKNTNAEVTFQAASGNTLYFYEAPNLKFGIRSISLDDRYYGHHDAAATKVIVDDIRGNQQGWRVQVKLSPFTATSGTPATLTGAAITFGRPDTVTSNFTPAPTPAPYLGATSSTSFVKVESDNVSVRVLTAEAGTGMARTTFEWVTNATAASVDNPASNLANTKIELMVVGGSALARNYEAQLEWELYNTP